MPKRTICVVTGSRAEYGILRWLMRGIQEEPDLRLQIIATGMHLSPAFGLTYQEIIADGFSIDASVDTLLSSDSPTGITKSIGLGVIGFADAFDRLRPDIVVVLGDRYEILAAAQAALMAQLPLAHLHGGELSEGAIDESIRHAITKMSHMHFVAAESYRQRVIQMGERPERVWNVGTLALDALSRIEWLDRAACEQTLGISLRSPVFVITYHPPTLSRQDLHESTTALFEGLAQFPAATLIFTKANADSGGRAINDAIDHYVNQIPERARAVTSLGQSLYLNVVRQADVVIGNSSSGLIEAPALHRPTVNIGERQQGRLRAASVVDCVTQADAIAQAIQHALDPEFQRLAAGSPPPYGGGNTATVIIKHLKSVELDEMLVKRFYDIRTDVHHEDTRPENPFPRSGEAR